jgi:Zn-dependent peptidase ImmA (M78 family)/transcriptional regulator with XRE-family HTH domain
MPHFNSGLLTLARESREVLQSDLSHVTNVPQTLISRFEAGITQPNEEQIAVIAKALQYPVDLFFQEDRIFGFNASVFFHRKRADMPAKTLRRIHAVLNLTRMRVDRMMLAASISPQMELMRMSVEEFGSPENIARQVRALLHLPLGPVNNLTAAVEDVGIIIAMHRFGSTRTDAVSEWIPGHQPIILMNADDSIGGDRYRWTLAHELGHLIMHAFPSEKMEEEANRFASEFLMPASEIKHQLRNIRLPNLALLKGIWKVSMGALLERAKQLGTINSTQHRYMRVKFGSLHYNTREPAELDIPIERPTLLGELVNAHVKELRFDVEDLARLLNLLPEECADLYAPEFSRSGLRLIRPNLMMA